MRMAPTALLALAAVAAAQQTPPLVRGRVVDETGRPLAKISAGPQGGADAAVETGADGTFELPAGERPRPLRVVLQGRGRASAEVTATERGGDFVLPRGGIVAGRVVGEDGAPVAGARIRVVDLLDRGNEWFARTPSPYIARAESKPDGSFVVVGALASLVAVEVDHDDWLPAVVEAPRAGRPVEVTMVRPRLLHGLVVGPDGQPIPGARVQGRAQFGRSASATADEAGRFVLRAPPTPSLQLSAHHADGQRTLSGSVQVEAAPATEAEPLRIELAERQAPAPVTRLRVRAADGSPLRTVRAVPVPTRVQPDSVERALANSAAREPDPDGIVEVRGEAAAVEVLAEGHGRVRVPVDGGGDLEVELPPPSALRGRLVEPGSGAPLAEVAVAVMRAEDWEDEAYQRHLQSFGLLHPPTPPQRARSDADGRFAVDALGPGRWVVWPMPGDRPRIEPVRVEIAAGASVDDLTVELGPGSAVRLRCRGGTLPPGVSLRLPPKPPEGLWSGNWERSIDGDGRPADDGTLEFRGLGPGRYLLEVVVPQPLRLGLPWKLKVREVEVGAADVEVELDHGASAPRSVRGPLQFAGARPPADRAVVVAEPRLGPLNTFYGNLRFHGALAPVARDGGFELRLPPATYDLLVLDAATRVPLTRAHELVVPTADLPAPRPELDAEVCEVRVGLGGPADLRRSADRLAVDLGAFYPGGIGRIAPRQNIGTAFSPDVGAPLGQGPVELWLPRGELRLVAIDSLRGPDRGLLGELDLVTTRAERLDVVVELGR